MTHTPDDVQRLVAAVEHLQDALARRILAEWNAANVAAGTPRDWPAGQQWNDLVPTSHAIFRQMARAEAGLDRTPAFREWLTRLVASEPGAVCRVTVDSYHGGIVGRPDLPDPFTRLAPLPTLSESPDAGET